MQTQDADSASVSFDPPTRPNFSGLSLRDIEYVVAVADRGSVARAAIHCHVAGPTLSVQVRRIEDRLGIRLFDRQGRQWGPTVAASPLIAQMRRVLREGAALLALASRPASPFNGLLRLSALDTLGPYFFPRSVARLRATFPTVDLRLGDVTPTQARAALQAGDIDLALLSATATSPGIVYRRLFRERLVLAVPDGHRYARAETVSWSALDEHERLWLGEGHCLRDMAITLSGGSPVTRPSVSLEALRYRVAAGEGCTLIPGFAATPCEGLTYRSVAEPGFHRDIVLAWANETKACIDEENLNSLVATLTLAGTHAGALHA